MEDKTKEAREKMNPSIFNDVIGPVMRGPSSSHTAASHRIGTIIRQISPPENGKVLVEFDRKGSLATTYEGQGSAMGLISGLLGVCILDPSIVRYRELAGECKMDIQFRITNFEASHPNTYRIAVEDSSQRMFQFTALSTGGGMIEVRNINGFEVMIRGDYFETMVFCEAVDRQKARAIFQLLKNQTAHSEIHLFRNDRNGFLINIKSRVPLLTKTRELLSESGDISLIRGIDPVMPVLAGTDEKLPFTTVNELLSLSDQNGLDLAGMAVMYESARSGKDAIEVTALMHNIVSRVKEAIAEGLKGTEFNFSV